MMLTDEQSKAVRDAFGNGESIYSIAKRLHIPYTAVWRECGMDASSVYALYAQTRSLT